MSKISYELTPRDVLFLRDARPMDVDKVGKTNLFNVGHGANWPRPDNLYNAAIHELIHDPLAPESNWYREVPDLRVTGPFPLWKDTLYLPRPLDWDMTFTKLDAAAGATDIPAPLMAGFLDRVVEKKSYPKWVTVADYERYLRGEIGKGFAKDKPDEPKNDDGRLMTCETRMGTTLNPETGASKRIEGQTATGQFCAEYLRLGEGVTMACEIESEKRASDIEKLAGCAVRMGGQGGLVRFAKMDGKTLRERLVALPKGALSRYVRWTLLTPALFTHGWYPNWLEIVKDGEKDRFTGKVMLPKEGGKENVLRRAGESRAAFRARRNAACSSFSSAHLVAACVGKAIAFSGYDTIDREKPTELAVPAGSCYVFECDTEREAAALVETLNLRALSDCGEKGFGLGVCSYVAAPKDFQETETTKNN
jgi:CRISPR type III-B/RAMP module-associated protein Cmr3